MESVLSAVKTQWDSVQNRLAPWLVRPAVPNDIWDRVVTRAVPDVLCDLQDLVKYGEVDLIFVFWLLGKRLLIILVLFQKS